MNQIFLIGLATVAIATIYLFIQNRRLKALYDAELNRINTNIQQLTYMLTENNKSNTQTIPPHSYANDTNSPIERNSSIPEPALTKELLEDININNGGKQDTYSRLKTEYDSFSMNTELGIEEKYEGISNDLKKEIEGLELRESSSNEVDSKEDNLSDKELQSVDDINIEKEADESTENVLEEFSNANLNNMVDNIIKETTNKLNSDITEISELENSINNFLPNTKDNIELMTVKELQDIARQYNLKTTGKKNILVDRIKSYKANSNN